jgi:hypothetical protein
MAKLVLDNCYVLMGATNPPVYNLSDHIASITLSTVHDIIETTEFGQIAKTRIAGLADNSVTFEFHQDFSTGSVEDVIYPALGTALNCIIKPNGNVTSATNPAYSFSVLISEWTPLNGSAGDLATASVTWPISGEITKTTTP